MNQQDLFDEVVRLPSSHGASDYERLMGLDEVKRRLVNETLLLIDPAQLTQWSTQHYGGDLPALDYFRARPPLFVLAGDVGTGKTVLARTFGNEVAKLARVSVELYSMSLNARGRGAVGEMTRLISSAFSEVRDAVGKSREMDGKAGRGIILLIDEADALAQSREASQMHHEDRAGVNALIRGIDGIAEERLPVAVIMCTNRLDAIDPAVRRRAAAVFDFHRPNYTQRKTVLQAALNGCGLSAADFESLAQATGHDVGEEVGFTYSDLTQRLIPAIVLDAFPNEPISAERALEIARTMKSTPQFRSERQEPIPEPSYA